MGRAASTVTGAHDLAARLQTSVRGEVRFDPGDRALYATDASNYRQVPVGVVVPRDAEDVVATVALCHDTGVPILLRGGGTSLAGQTCNAAVVIDTSKYMNRVLAVDPACKRARVQPGLVLDDLRAAAEKHHLTFAPDPSTHNRCTLGGMIGNDSCGVHSIMGGKTVDNVESLDILTYDGLRLTVGPTDDAEVERIIAAGGRRGEIYARLRGLRDRYAELIRARFPDIPRRVSGYYLDQLLPENGFNIARALVGSEGTCVTVLEATVRLVDSPPARTLVILGYPDVYAAGNHVPAVMEYGPVGLEGFDDRLTRAMLARNLHPEDVALLPEGGGWLLVEFGADTRDEAVARARELMDGLKRESNPPSMRLFDEPEPAKRMWEVRESGLGAAAIDLQGGFYWPGWEDSAVRPDAFGEYLRDLRALMDRYDYDGPFYGHFGHGCIHTRINFDLVTEPGIQKFRAFMYDAADLVLRYGGSLSGEHGDGQARGELWEKMFGPELMPAFREFKAIWDPDGKMNPGKDVDAAPMDANLRLGVTYNPPRPRTHFQFPDDNGNFAHATLRCVGVGKCRRLNGGTMCPSFMVTREEEHSTRGRARLLFEMLEGGPLTDGWRSEAVHEALDLCLACKGCKGECPVSVDMATYKAEFLSHYYQGRMRPLSAYAMGLIYWWARIASKAPTLVNALTHAPVLSDVGKRAVGLTPERSVPEFAPFTFKDWFRQRSPRHEGTNPVILWPDTFNNYFHPITAIAAVDVLEAAGCRVIVPQQSLCCGRPLYDYGMLSLATHLLKQILDALRPHVRADVPIVGLEPSCVSVFRDELTNLLPHDQDAQRLRSQTYLLSEFLEQCVPDYRPPTLARKAVVHGHCHHKSVLGMQDEISILRKLGLDFTVLDSGCCGLAGSFGFEAGDHYDVSMKCGERVLLPAVRAAGPDTLIITNGFSCREQIAHGTGREAMHVAQVLQLAMSREL